tara:strand:- start:22716 stop:23525 length:810 start_codon:yes stop_codon:yes gene_type:complete
MTTTINRQKIVAEELIRSYVRKRIKENINRKLIAEDIIRSKIRTMLLEAEAGSDVAPSESTGINVLAALLEKIIPVIEADYKMLTSSESQRESFKNHIIQAIKNSLKPVDAPADMNLPESFEFTLDKADLLREKLKISIDGDEEETVEGDFIDIEKGEDKDDFVAIDDQNETGRNFAAAAYKKVEKQIVDSYLMLADDEDKDVFYEYLLTNMLLYFDKFEDEIADSLPDQSTPEYEKEKQEKETEGTEDMEEPSEEEGAETEAEEELEI